ncbi:MAG: hypothetical protein ACRETP_03470 [Steroidobacteraceae bacterium]
MTLAVNAFAAPPHGQHAPSPADITTGRAMSGKSAHCAGMSHATPQTASMPLQSLHHTPTRHALPGHDGGCPCCNGTDCTCASMCGGMTAIAYVAMFDPTHGTVQQLASDSPLTTHFAPPLRPPIL